MAGQSEAADDLIAELAKLMAQDAQGERKAQPSAAAEMSAQFTPVRIPGDSNQAPAASPPTDFLRSLSASADSASADKVSAPAVRDEPARPETDTPGQQAAGATPEPEPFHFDFGLSSGNRAASAADEAPAEATAPPRPTGASFEDRDVHDTIADLISAELASDPGQLPQPDPVAPIAPAPEPRPAQSPGPAPMATAVAANNGPQHGVSLGDGRTDQDRFKVPPVFGLGSTAARPVAPAANTSVANAPAEAPHPLPRATAPKVVAPTPVASNAAELDPIEEIESLIGRAMRVEFDLPADEIPAPEPTPVAAAPRPAPSPALRSLATPTAPNSEAGGLSPADQTIFAAAQATGAKVGWVNEPPTADVETEAEQAAPRRRGAGMSRAVAGPLVAITLLLASGFGLYWVLGLGSRDTGPAPLLTADTAPSKEVAPVVAADDGTTPQSVVFNEMDGVAPGANEQLVSRDQSDVNEVTQVATAAADLSEEGLANRKVRTVKVRPDGTIVSGDDSVAGSAILPVDRPNVPAVPGVEDSAPELLANTDSVLPAVESATPTATLYPVSPGSTVPAVDLEGKLIAGKSATIPLVRPIGLRLPDGAQQATSNTLASPVAAAAAATPSLTIPGAVEVQSLGDTAPAYVQLASQRSEADARQSAQNMVTRYGPLFGGANLEVQRVDLGAKGIYYRVRVPANSLEQARMICTNVKAAGGDCFTL
ncbi:MAG: SPOR domain-containing protein [Devosia sp.]